MGLPEPVRQLADSQYGIVAARQVIEATADRRCPTRLIRAGLLRRETSRVLRVVGTPGSRAQRALTAVLHTGTDAILSHTSAAAWWRIPGFQLEPLHTAVARNRRRVDSGPAHVHHATVIPEREATVLDGVPIASPGLTLFQLAGMIGVDRLEAAVDAAWSLRLVDGAALGRLLDRLAQRGRNGIVAMRHILEERGEDWVPPQSNLESRFLRLTREAGIGHFRCQVHVGTGRWTGRVDFLADDVPLIVEVQSERYHTALTDRTRDALRRSDLEADGFTVLEIWDTELFGASDVVEQRIREARRAIEAAPRARPL